MRDLNYQLKLLCKYSHQGSFGTQANRERNLSLIANQLYDLGFKGMGAKSLREKHVKALVDLWKQQGLSPGTIKNRMSAVRWWAGQINRPNVVANANSYYGIEDRSYVSEQSKAINPVERQLIVVRDEHVRMSLRLQQAFGLRREEALKIHPRFADKDYYLKLNGSWTKGGKPRTVPIRTSEQREILEQAKLLVGRGSMIPYNRSYIHQVRIYERHTANAGLCKMHGLRHAYAQQRYLELTDWQSPHAGGPAKKELSGEQRIIDYQARLTISKELGHEREQITAVYLGR